MAVLAIQEVLRRQETFEDAKETFKVEHSLRVKEYVVSGKKVMLLTRDPELEYTSVVQDEASLMIIDEDLNIIAKGSDRIYKTSLDYIDVLIASENEPLLLQEFHEGIEIVISKFNSTYLISTKDDIHGFPHTKIVMNIINKLWPVAGLDSLFNANWFTNVSWIFNLIKHNNDYKLHLTGAFDLDHLREFSIKQLNNIAVYLNLEINDYQNIYVESQLEDSIQLLLARDINLKYVKISDHKNNSWKIPVNPYSKTNVLKHIAKCIIENDETQLNAIDEKYNDVVSLIKYRYHTCGVELCRLFTKNENIRTRKMYAAKVKHHPFAAAIFALKDKKITGFYDMARVIKPINLLNIVEEKDRTQLYALLKDI